MVRGIKYIAPLPPGGYAEAAKRAMLGLVRAGVPVTFLPLVEGRGLGMNLEPYSGRSIADPDLAPLCNRPIDYDTVIVHAPPELFPPMRAAEPGKLLVGATVWETDRLLPHWLPWLEAADRIVVPCQWNRSVFIASGIRRPVHVVPHICADFPAALAEADSRASANDFVFYSIGIWSSRKGWESLIRAYLTAFTANDAVTLVIKTTERNLTRLRPWVWPRTTRGAVRQLCGRSRSGAKIRVVTEALSEAELAALHREGDCYVSLPHAEGWGLGIFDAAAAGNPVVTTGYGGPLDYLGEDYPFLVNHRVGPAQARGFERKLFLPDQNWAIPDEDDAARKMRLVFDEKRAGTAAAAARRVQERIRRRYDAGTVTAELLNVLGAP